MIHKEMQIFLISVDLNSKEKDSDDLRHSSKDVQGPGRVQHRADWAGAGNSSCSKTGRIENQH